MMRSVAGLASTIHQRFLEDFVFIHINKCGGTSVERALGIPLRNHDTAAERRSKLGERAWKKRFKFCVVRDPYHRAASLFSYRHRHEAGFRSSHLADRFVEWLATIERRHEEGTAGKFIMPQTFWITDETGGVIVDHICRLESLEKDLDLVRQRISRPIETLHLNKSRHQIEYDDLYSAQARAMVESLFPEDFERLGYPVSAARGGGPAD